MSYSCSAFSGEPGLTVWFLLELFGGYKTLHARKDPISDKGSGFCDSILEGGWEGSFHHVGSKAVSVCLHIVKNHSINAD